MCSAKVFEAEAKKQPSVKAMMDDIVRFLWRVHTRQMDARSICLWRPGSEE